MKSLVALVFALSITYAVVGNVVVLLILIRRRTPFRFIWAGTPLYLYGICNRSTPPTSRALTGFALSTNIALFVAIPSWICLAIAVNN
jgi:hypothetical protein